MTTVEIICLANSWKHGGRCVAGLRTDGGGWVRPISAEPKGVLQSKQYLLAWKKEAALLDVLRVGLLDPKPSPHQPENWLLNPARWKRCRPFPAQDVANFLEQNLSHGPQLLGSTTEKIAYSVFQHTPAAESLALIRPQTLSWQIRKTAAGRRKIRAVFTLAGVKYSLPLTDPAYQKRLAVLPDGNYAWEPPEQEPLLTISLGEPFGRDSDCYKLVAGVVALPVSKPHNIIVHDKRKSWRIIWDWMSGRAG